MEHQVCDVSPFVSPQSHTYFNKSHPSRQGSWKTHTASTCSASYLLPKSFMQGCHAGGLRVMLHCVASAREDCLPTAALPHGCARFRRLGN
jgi:hypothetical protein